MYILYAACRHCLRGVGKTRKESLGILYLIGNATEQEVKTNYRKITRIEAEVGLQQAILEKI